jgi:hypothetical protein
MEINKTSLIEKNKKILDEIRELIDTNSPIGFILKSNFILNNSYINKVIILTHQLSLNYFFYKKKFYFTRNGTWFEYLTNNLEIIKKDGMNEKSLININLAIVVGKTKIYKIFKRILKKYIKNQIVTIIGDEKPENTEEYFNLLNNYHEDYQKIVNSNEKTNFYQILLTLCEYIFTYNKDEIYFKSHEEDGSQDFLSIDEINDLILY